MAACQNTPTTPEAGPAPSQLQDTTVLTTQAQPEYVEWNTLTINGKPRQELTTQSLARQLGRPDSIAKGLIECGGALDNLNKADSTNGDFWYYGKTMYEVSSGQAILHSFDVTTGKFQGRVGQILLTEKTTLEDVRRFFPVSAKQADRPATGRPGEVMSVPFSTEGVPEEGALTLTFKKGRLQEVEFFFPC